jgi:bifunctional UDP-N-acetylglucosamine pyrophosphorylase/glucosamine-1-phosphate N-acetyltransferase
VTNEQRLRSLKSRGVEIIDPASTHVAEDVEPERIEPGVRIYGGCRIAGKRTFIGKGAIIGREGPVAVEDCAMGNDVELKAGSFKGSVLLDRSVIGPGAQVREACLLEEEASCAHTVGLKQTILFPFVTLGSLINFCDCLIAGGTSRKDHSEVGSSYVHFNFTPNQDKATPSLLGDVPRGVMLSQRPIFLGGQGGLVGPARIGFGSVIAAGIVCRADVGENVLVTGARQEAKQAPYRAGLYPEIRRKVQNNITYLANLVALRFWYADIRSQFLNPIILQEALTVLNEALAERVSRLKALAEKMPESVKGLKSLKLAGSQKVIAQEMAFHAASPRIDEYFFALKENQRVGSESQAPRDAFLKEIAGFVGKDYVKSIRSLDASAKRKGTVWLSSIVRKIERAILALLPSFR